MKLPLVVALLPLAACGRTGFDVVPDALPPAVLECGTAPQVDLGQDVQFLAATSTPDGYAVFTTDFERKVNGIPVSLSPLDPTHTPAVGTPVLGIADQALGALGAFASGNDLELAVPYTLNDKDPAGTKLVPLSAQLTSRDAPSMLDGWFAQAGSIAYNSKGVAINVLEQIDHTISATTAASASAAWSAKVQLIPGSSGADEPVVVAADEQFLVAWITGSSNASAQMFATDPIDGIKPTTPASTVITSLTSPAFVDSPRVAYATGHGLALFVWYTKNNGNQSWYSLRNAQLQVIAEGKLSDNAYGPVTAAGDQDFLIAWHDDTKATLGAARLGFDGTLTPVNVATTGSDALPNSWTVVNHNGQPTLIWAQPTASSTIAWLNPACAAPSP